MSVGAIIKSTPNRDPSKVRSAIHLFVCAITNWYWIKVALYEKGFSLIQRGRETVSPSDVAGLLNLDDTDKEIYRYLIRFLGLEGEASINNDTFCEICDFLSNHGITLNLSKEKEVNDLKKILKKDSQFGENQKVISIINVFQ